MWFVKCPVYFSGICLIRRASRDCKGRYNLARILSDPRGGCGEIEPEEEEYRCGMCNKEISQEEYEEFNGLCRRCRGGPIQRGFPSPKGFPKI